VIAWITISHTWNRSEFNEDTARAIGSQAKNNRFLQSVGLVPEAPGRSAAGRRRLYQNKDDREASRAQFQIGTLQHPSLLSSEATDAFIGRYQNV
jgi:hypothetical protein